MSCNRWSAAIEYVNTLLQQSCTTVERVIFCNCSSDFIAIDNGQVGVTLIQ